MQSTTCDNCGQPVTRLYLRAHNFCCYRCRYQYSKRQQQRTLEPFTVPVIRTYNINPNACPREIRVPPGWPQPHAVIVAGARGLYAAPSLRAREWRGWAFEIQEK